MTYTKTAATGVVLLGTALYYWPTASNLGDDVPLNSAVAKAHELRVAPSSPQRGTQRSPGKLRKPMFKLGLSTRPAVSVADFEALRARVARLEEENDRLSKALRSVASPGNGAS